MKAFPTVDYIKPGEGMGVSVIQLSVNLRDYFAAQSIAGFFSEGRWYGEGEYFLSVAKDAYRLADAMMEARKQ